MATGLMCQYLFPRVKRDCSTIYENIIEEKSLQLGQYKAEKYSEERIRDTYRHNVDEHIKIIPNLLKDNIQSFRISSSLFPLFEFAGDIARNDQVLISKLAVLGSLFRENGIRVTTHPGQFTVLSSDRDQVVMNSIKELEYHAWVFDCMGLSETPYNAINIHGGKADRSSRLIEVIKTLPSNVRNRLTLENDEKCYNVKALLQISHECDIPVVLDSHHYTFGSNDISYDDAFTETIKTWKDIKPLQHLSNTEPGMESGSFNEKRTHSNFIHYINQHQLDALRNDTIDVDLEAKMKNIALLKFREEYGILV
jgi:UV DNA damage endonuclease